MVKNKVKLEVCNVKCTLITEESEGYMQELAAQVEGVMQGFMRATGSYNVELAAVTTALSFCDEAKKSVRSETTAQDEDNKLRLSVAEKGRTAAEERQRILERELQGLQAQLGEAEKQIATLQKVTASASADPVIYPSDLRNPMRPEEEFEQQGLVSFFEKKFEKKE